MFALDLLFTLIFTVEAVCKILCLGLVSDFSQPVRSSYLSDGWNVLDLCLIVLAFVDIGMDHTQAVGLSAAFRFPIYPPVFFYHNSEQFGICDA